MQPETANRSLEEMDDMFAPDKTKRPFLDKYLTRIHPIRDPQRMRRLQKEGRASSVAAHREDEKIPEKDTEIEQV